MANTLHADMPLRNDRGEEYVIVDRTEHERFWIRQEAAAIKAAYKALHKRRRQLRQLRDTHELEAR